MNRISYIQNKEIRKIFEDLESDIDNPEATKESMMESIYEISSLLEDMETDQSKETEESDRFIKELRQEIQELEYDIENQRDDLEEKIQKLEDEVSDLEEKLNQ